MFGFFRFFKKRPPPDPPTDKQRRYAARLGITIPASMSKGELSKAIAEAERRNPAIARQRERASDLAREKRFGKETVQQEEQWNRFAEEVGYMLAVYSEGKETVVDVLHVSEAYIYENGDLCLGVESPKLVKDRDIGDYLDWKKEFELDASSLLYREPLHSNFNSDGTQAYLKVVKKGLKIAHKEAKKKKR